MADAINWDQVYNDYITEYTSGVDQTSPDYGNIVAAARRKAGEMAAYGRLTGSKKNPTKWYTLGEWIDYSAPSYKSVRDYKGTDEATKYISKEIKALEADPNKAFDIGAVNSIAEGLGQQGYTRGEAYDIVKSIYDEFSAAKRNYKRQSTSHPYSQYGLPDPTTIYGLQDGTTTTFVIGNDGKPVKRKVKVVAYVDPKTGQSAKDWVIKKTAAYQDSLIKKGVDAATAKTRAIEYGQALKTSVEAKIQASGVTPFIEAAAKRARTRG